VYTPAILHKGPFSAFDLAVTGNRWQANEAYEERVRGIWSQRVEAAAVRGHHLWDGTHYRFNRIDDLADGRALRLGTVAFRYIATYRALHDLHGAHGLSPIHHISTAALLLTADGHYVFGKRAINGAVDLIGGGFQPDDEAPGFARNTTKEIREETGIGADALGARTELGVVMSTTSNVLVIEHIALKLTRDGVMAAFETREEDEMAEPVFVPRAGIADYLKSMTDYRPLVADLL
jgi:hypothetical protein